MVRWIALESNFNLDLRPTIIYGRTLQSRQRGDPFFVESGRGKGCSPYFYIQLKKLILGGLHLYHIPEFEKSLKIEVEVEKNLKKSRSRKNLKIASFFLFDVLG